MNEKNNNAFLRSIKGAKPIKKGEKILKKIPKTDSRIKKTKAQTTIIDSKSKSIPQKNNQFETEKLTPNKKLRRGKIPIDLKIDFHGLSVLDAEGIFKKTIINCYKKNIRCILFVTGKGILKKQQNTEAQTKLYYGKIRSNFLDWTKSQSYQKYILSVERANIEHGGDGAFFVYLRKNKN